MIPYSLATLDDGDLPGGKDHVDEGSLRVRCYAPTRFVLLPARVVTEPPDRSLATRPAVRAAPGRDDAFSSQQCSGLEILGREGKEPGVELLEAIQASVDGQNPLVDLAHHRGPICTGAEISERAREMRERPPRVVVLGLDHPEVGAILEAPRGRRHVAEDETLARVREFRFL